MSVGTPVDLPAQGSEFRRARLIRFSDCDRRALFSTRSTS